ncbi:MAG: hypothetical protein M1826_005898 [Phylliscum demangeonii]|nr:MAG: hypothetical protein M1826_005898 [Phylliscum demangeonii]
MAPAGDGSEEVHDFLRRIRELDDQRNREDDERTRKLEEEILQGRRERQARRAARARSVSPIKGSPLYPPLSWRPDAETRTAAAQARHGRSMEPGASRAQVAGISAPSTATRPAAIFAISSSPSDPISPPPHISPPTSSAEPESRPASARPSPSAAMPSSRASALSWQRRPDSSPLGSVRRRPLSALDPVSYPITAAAPGAPSPARDLSRAEMTASLQTKDPSWFRQTEDRASTSPAYRRDHAATAADAAPTHATMPLPGMVAHASSSALLELTSLPQATSRSSSPVRAGSIRASRDMGANYSVNSTISGAPFRPMARHRPGIPSFHRTETEPESSSETGTGATSPSPARTRSDLGERPSSPTKGLGGFVQSAMLKRSDSVQKRWSAQAHSRLGREGSVRSPTGTPSTVGGLPALGEIGPSPDHTRQRSRGGDERSREREASPEAGHAGGAREPEDDDSQAVRSPADAITRHRTGPGRTGPPSHHRYGSTASATLDESIRREPISPRKGSPPLHTKTADPKRWSPTKASWLESALNKAPDSPRKPAPASQLPTWMSEMVKSRQHDGVHSGGLDASRTMPAPVTDSSRRSFPVAAPFRDGDAVKAMPNAISNIISAVDETTMSPAATSSPPIGPKPAARKPAEVDHAASGATPAPDPKPRSPSADALSATPRAPRSETPPPTESPSEPARPSPAPKPSLPQSPSSLPSSAPDPRSTSIPSRRNAASPLAAGARPPSPQSQRKAGTPPPPAPQDFRSVLKSRHGSDTQARPLEPEFKEVFGKLKRTNTQKYVAPNELRDNILRGKAGLTITGGPVKTARRDELKESLLRQRDAIHAQAKANRIEPEAEMSSPGGGPSGLVPTSASGANDGVANGAGLAISSFGARLGALIAQGPPPPPATTAPDADPSPAAASVRSAAPPPPPPHPASSSALTHPTKDRARGPQRRLPRAKLADGPSCPSPSPSSSSSPPPPPPSSFSSLPPPASRSSPPTAPPDPRQPA